MHGLTWKWWIGVGFGALVAATIEIGSWARGPAALAVAPQREAQAHEAVAIGAAPAPARSQPASVPAGADSQGAAASASGGYALTEAARYRPNLPGSATRYSDFSAVAVGDVNGDGRADVVATTMDHSLQVFLQQPQGGLGFPPLVWRYPNSLSRPTRLLLVDLNGDGALDMVTQRWAAGQGGNTQDEANALLSDGRGGFKPPQPFQPDSGVEGWSGVDVDHDGHQDIVGIDMSPAAQCSVPPQDGCWRLRTLYGDGRGGIREVGTTPLPRTNPRIESVRDYDGDGRSDIVYTETAYASAAIRLLWMRHLPQGGFAAPALLIDAIPLGPTKELALGDFNGDRRLDLAIVSAQQAYSVVYSQQAGGGFAAAQPVPALELPKSRMLVDDFDGDGRSDLVAIRQIDAFNDPSLVALGYNLQRDGALAATQWNGSSRTLPQFSSPLRQIDHGDFNGDGCLDVVAAASDQGLAFFYGSGCAQAQVSSLDCRIEQSAPWAAALPGMGRFAAAASPVAAARVAPAQAGPVPKAGRRAPAASLGTSAHVLRLQQR
ncbi:FG-GAP repeat domain-containing protein [Lysobacter enzymogenes]|uniref:FG-GAP repeat domain-containing protein n=1 Tax=Lysobacter enzymogenes TaxID=69 RepID=UPI00099BCD5B|nr:VCBS repeat-containing protein [Lysobacter enzymogenes]UZW58896.1 VCBS repeat-containing protein [Lysobacter enzymogenes]